MIYLYVAVVSWSSAFFPMLCIGWLVKTRLVKRLAARQGALEAIAELENRKVGYETGRQELVRRDAGRQAREFDGMDTKPGALARYLAGYQDN